MPPKNALGPGPIGRHLVAACLLLLSGAASVAAENNYDVAKLQALADQGDLGAQTDLGWAYCNGERGVPLDKTRGPALLQDAVAKGFVRAEFCLAGVYEKGSCVAADPAQALAWYQKAADAHFPRAEGYLGWICLQGKLGHPVDLPAALAWYEKAARNGDAFSVGKLAWLYLNGTCGPKDRAKAFFWFQRAAEEQQQDVASLLSLLYEQGKDGIPQDSDRAWLWRFIGQSRGFSQTSYATANFDQLRRLSAKMDDAHIGRLTRLALDYMACVRDGGYALDPALPPMDLTPASLSEHPVEIEEDRLIVPVMIGSKGPFRFLVDSGASGSLVSSSLAETLGLPAVGLHAAYGKEDALAKIVSVDYTVLDNEVRHASLIVESLDDDARYAGQPLDGILGYDFLSHFTVKVDYAAHTLGLYNPEELHPDASFTALPAVLQAGDLSVSTTLNGLNHPPITQNFIVDTGNSGAMAFNRAFDLEYLFPRLVPRAVGWGSVSMWGLSDITMGRLPSLAVGAFQVPGPIVACDPEFLPSPSPLGTIGNEIWRRFVIVLDYKDKKLFLQKGPGFDAPETRAYHGLFVLADEKDPALLRVAKAFDASPAAAAGFQKDDLITACDGLTGPALTSDSLRDRLHQEGDHSLTVKRGETVLTLPLKSVPF